MNEITNINHCERAGELVAYFYGEANRAEREAFDAHLLLCGACRNELAAFAGVREAVGHWRAEVLNAAPAPSFADSIAAAPPSLMRLEPQPEITAGVSSRAVSPRFAFAALREFFTLSPAWLRAGVAAATLAVCALATLAVVNAEVRWDESGLAFSTRLPRSVTENPLPRTIETDAREVSTRAELDKLVAERDAALRELEDTRAQLDDSRAANLIAAVETLEPASAAKALATPNHTPRGRRAAPAPAVPDARRKRLREERDEEDMPRLYDLLIEAN